MRFSAARVEALVWVLIYVGMVLAALGVAVQRDGASSVGWSLVAFGTGFVVAGIVLVWIRSRMNGDR